MRLGKDLIGKLIISLSDGKNLGKVKGIYLDAATTTIAGILVNYEGFIKRQPVVVSRANISLFGEDAILITNPEAIVKAETIKDQFEQWHSGDTVVNRPIETPGGTKVATIGDLILNNETNVVGFTLSRIFVDGPVAQNKAIFNDAIVDLGTESGVMTVDLSLAEKQMLDDEQAEETANPIVAQFAAAKESVTDLFNNAKEEVIDLADSVEESGSDLIDELAEKVDDAQEVATDTIADINETVTETTETAVETIEEIAEESVDEAEAVEEAVEESIADMIDITGDKLEEIDSELTDLTDHSE